MAHPSEPPLPAPWGQHTTGTRVALSDPNRPCERADRVGTHVNTRTIAVVSGSRADYGIVQPILRQIDDDPDLALQLIVTGMHLSHEFGHTVDAIEQDGFWISGSTTGWKRCCPRTHPTEPPSRSAWGCSHSPNCGPPTLPTCSSWPVPK